MVGGIDHGSALCGYSFSTHNFSFASNAPLTIFCSPFPQI